jgi:glutaredoxin
VIRGAFLIVIFLCAGAAQAQLYRWVDENGRVRYSDTPPPASAKDVQKKRYGTGAGAGEPGMPYATQRAMQEYPVVLYTVPDCGKFCADAKAMLEKRGIPYGEVVVRSNEQIEEMRRKLGGKNQVPALMVGADGLSGFEPGAWNAALDRAGYPSSSGAYKPRPEVASASLPPVKLYTNSECKALCAAARSLLAGRKVRFQEVAVETEDTFDELQKVSGSMSVPVLMIGKVVQKGYEPATYQRLLDEAGFPKLAERK